LPSLAPERSRSFDAGVEQAFARGHGLVEATVFFNNYDDLIVATGSFSGSSRYRTDNISNARARGLELAGTARARLRGLVRGTLQIRLGYTRLATEILAVDQSGAAPPPFAVGDPLLRRPEHLFSTDVMLSAGRLAAFVQGGARSSVRDVDPSFGTFGGLFDAPGYSVWNAGASWAFWRHLHVFGRVTNLFDRDYEEALGYPALGRSGMVGLRVAASR
jgi:outer membrane receptor protein involved in Fe transport